MAYGSFYIIDSIVKVTKLTLEDFINLVVVNIHRNNRLTSITDYGCDLFSFYRNIIFSKTIGRITTFWALWQVLCIHILLVNCWKYKCILLADGADALPAEAVVVAPTKSAGIEVEAVGVVRKQ